MNYNVVWFTSFRQVYLRSPCWQRQSCSFKPNITAEG